MGELHEHGIEKGAWTGYSERVGYTREQVAELVKAAHGVLNAPMYGHGESTLREALIPFEEPGDA